MSNLVLLTIFGGLFYRPHIISGAGVGRGKYQGLVDVSKSYKNKHRKKIGHYTLSDSC